MFMSNLKFEVDELVKHPAGSRKNLIRNTIEFSDSVVFPFNDTISSIKRIYPNKQLVFTFTII